MPNATKPPSWADWLLETCLAPHILEDVQGDLKEVFHKRIRQVGVRRARREYSWAVLHYLSPFFFKRKTTNRSTYHARSESDSFPLIISIDMLRNYIKIALRTFWRARLYVTLNVFGLAIGLACMILAALYAHDEHRYDEFHSANPNLYRITTTYVENRGGQQETVGGTGQVQGPSFAANVPEVLRYVRVMGGDIYDDIRVGPKALKLQPLYVDDSFLQIFSFRLLHGNPKTALQGVNSVVVTEQTAQKLFGRTDVVGEFLHLDANPSAQQLGNKPLVITGVAQNPPVHSSLQFDLLHPFRFMQISFVDTYWLNAYLSTFVELQPNASLTNVTRKFNQLYNIHARQQLTESRRNDHHDPNISYGLQPITDIHLNPLYNSRGNREGGIVNGSKPLFSYLFLGIAGFILLMASINFINISIASALKRTKEVGIRKVTGGQRFQLIAQFLGESTLLCGLSFGLALGLVQVGLPIFNQLSGKAIASSHIFMGQLPLWLVGLFVINILLAGFYPAFVLAKVNPTIALYRRAQLHSRHGFGRGLVVIQFSLAVFLLIATLIFHGQMRFIQTKELGYNPFQVVRSFISGNRDLKRIAEYIRNEVAQEPSIRQISFGEEWGDAQDVTLQGRSVASLHTFIDRNFLSVHEVRLKIGRNITSETAQEVLVNEAFVKTAGLTNPLQTMVRLSKSLQENPVRIVGIIRDFHASSLKERIKPMVFIPHNGKVGSIWFKVSINQQAKALAAFEGIYKKAVPGGVYEYEFLDKLNAREYAQEQRWQQIIRYATLLSLLICGLGLFGLSHLSTEQRAREIGIRKTLGASTISITSLLSKDFLKLVLIAIILASPVAWWVMNHWLQGFVYRISIDWSVFGLAGILAISIALLTIVFQTLKAALENPVKSLRSE